MRGEPVVVVTNLRKTYAVPVREAGVGASLRSLIRLTTRDVHAVDGLTLTVPSGEITGFLGPNGAGKTTTLKVLAGLLHPSGGEARVLGHDPCRREPDSLRQITPVMGQRNQLQWDIPVADAFKLNRAIYRVPQGAFRKALDDLVSLLDLSALLPKPVRQLSLGERMKCEIAVALLHQPRVLFLDEPTIGLDVTMQRRIRSFVAEYNRRQEATVLLTSHYMADVESLCRRVIVIHHGRLLFDGDLSTLVDRFAPHKTITIDLESDVPDVGRLLHGIGDVASSEDGRIVVRVPKRDTARATAEILDRLPVADFSVEDPPVDDVIERVFASTKEVDASSAEYPR
jgi:ABC-2 type transport system ATP-binding protein